MKFRSFLARMSARLLVRFHPHLRLHATLPDFSFVEDGLGTIHDSEFAFQPRFLQAYAAGKATGSWGDHELRWRIHLLLWCASLAVKLDGVFVECGVNRGGFAKAIIDYTGYDALNRDYYLFDTFSGFDSSQLSLAEQTTVLKAYAYEDCYSAAQKTFCTMPFVKLVRGIVPGSLKDVGKVAFLSIDMNCTVPEISALRFFWPHLVKGAPVILDDYGFDLHREQKIAFDSLAIELGVEILSLPTGQGLLFKS